MKKILMILILLGIMPVFALMSPDLIRVVSQKEATDLIPVDIVFKEQMNANELKSAVQGLPRNLRRVRVAELLQAFSVQKQKEVLAYLREMEQQGNVTDIKSFWINNAIYCRANVEVIEILDRHDDIYYVDYDLKPISLDNPSHSFAPPDITREIAWGVLKVRADQVWPLYTGQGIIVGLIDTGCNYNHVDLTSHMWTDPNYPNHGWNFENDNNDPMDIQGHGTHCAGSIASDGTAGSQCGVAPEAQVMACRVRTVADTIAENQVWDAMQFVVSPPLSPANGGDLISMSLGWIYAWNPRRATWRTNCDNVGATGIVMIVAAGNEGGSSPPSNLRCPGDVPPPWWNPENGASGAPSDVVSIGATDINDAIASFSSRGPVTWQSIAPFNDYTYPPGLTAPDVSAPGVNIKSCAYNDNTGYVDGWNGTSMATPHTAGVAALMLEKNYLLTPLEIDSILETTAIDLGPVGKDNDFGAGRIDALDAINATPPPFSLRPLAHWIEDPAPGGNGNGMWESGEEVSLIVPVYNQTSNTTESSVATLSTSDTYVTVVSGTANLGDIAPGDTIDALFTVSASATTPQMHLVDFNLNLAYLGGDWDYSLYQYINPLPTLLYEHYTVVDGNNGILDPGESADLVITVKNEGAADAIDVSSTLMTASPYITINDNSGDFGTITVGDTANNAADPYNVTASGTTPYGTEIDFLIEVVSGIYIDTLDFALVVGQLVPSDTGLYYAYYSGGPHVQSPVFAWFAIDSTQTQNPGISTNIGDDAVVQVNLPFTFTYYGIDYTQLTIGSDGWVAMGYQTQYDQTNSAIPNSDGPSAMVAGLWDDLDPGNSGQPSDVYYYHDAANNRYIVEWFKVEHWPSGYHETFEIILYDPVVYPTPTGDGEIIVQYLIEMQEADNTLGIENFSETVGIQYYLDGGYDPLAAVVTDSFAIKYTTYPPDWVGIEEEGGLAGLPLKTLLGIMYPNPGLGVMSIRYQVAGVSDVSLCVYDAAGRLVRTIIKGACEPGCYTQVWDVRDDLGRRVPAGVYFIRFETDDYKRTEKAVLLR